MANVFPAQEIIMLMITEFVSKLMTSVSSGKSVESVQDALTDGPSIHKEDVSPLSEST